jgi:hypothetical protein
MNLNGGEDDITDAQTYMPALASVLIFIDIPTAALPATGQWYNLACFPVGAEISTKVHIHPVIFCCKLVSFFCSDTPESQGYRVIC